MTHGPPDIYIPEICTVIVVSPTSPLTMAPNEVHPWNHGLREQHRNQWNVGSTHNEKEMKTNFSVCIIRTAVDLLLTLTCLPVRRGPRRDSHHSHTSYVSFTQQLSQLRQFSVCFQKHNRISARYKNHSQGSTHFHFKSFCSNRTNPHRPLHFATHKRTPLAI